MQFDCNAEGVGYFEPSGWSAATTLGTELQSMINPERVRQLLNPYRVRGFIPILTQGCRFAPTAGLKLAKAFGVMIQISDCITT
jgi:hypothetical protein